MKNKITKQIIFFIFLLFLWTTNAFAQAKVSVGFCNSWTTTSTLNLDNVEAWEDSDICIKAKNNDNIKADVSMFFVDWVVNQYTPQFIACRNEKDEKKYLANFANFVNENWGKDSKITFNINPWEEIEKHAKVKFSDGFSGMSYWCLITITWEQKITKWKLNILLRKWNIIKAKVNWEIKVWLNISSKLGNNKHWTSDKPKALYLSDEVIIQEIWSNWVRIASKLENSWNVKITWEANLILKNTFWYEYKNKKSFTILPWEQNSLVFDINDLPFYKWTYEAKINFKYKPEFEFKSDQITEEMKKEKEANLEASFYIFPTKLLVEVILVILITILWVIIFKIAKRKSEKQNIEMANNNT